MLKKLLGIDEDTITPIPDSDLAGPQAQLEFERDEWKHRYKILRQMALIEDGYEKDSPEYIHACAMMDDIIAEKMSDWYEKMANEEVNI